MDQAELVNRYLRKYSHLIIKNEKRYSTRQNIRIKFIYFQDSIILASFPSGSDLTWQEIWINTSSCLGSRMLRISKPFWHSCTDLCSGAYRLVMLNLIFVPFRYRWLMFYPVIGWGALVFVYWSFYVRNADKLCRLREEKAISTVVRSATV